ncbi:MAG: uracil-DNA glycosylase [Candidatus Latescibacteria bacterium]|nr:uracil-DNA glycosylase [Candidatus Latescibacterota bacterium]
MQKCDLHKTRTHALPGESPADAVVCFVGEAPGRHEDEQGVPFIGAVGKQLDGMLEVAALSRDPVFITAAVKCRPPKNRDLKVVEISACDEHLFAQLDLLQPRLVVCLGRIALRTVLGRIELSDVRRRWVEKDGRLVTATYHTAAVFYNRSLAETIAEDMA